MTLFVDPYRPALLSFIGNLNLGTFKLSQNYPWMENGAPLYFTNKKTIYVDNPNTVQTASADTLSLDSSGFVEETTSVSVYFVTDAKRLPAEYDDVVNQIKAARTIHIDGAIRHLCRCSTTFHADDMLTTFVFSYTKILTN